MHIGWIWNDEESHGTTDRPVGANIELFVDVGEMQGHWYWCEITVSLWSFKHIFAATIADQRPPLVSIFVSQHHRCQDWWRLPGMMPAPMMSCCSCPVWGPLTLEWYILVIQPAREARGPEGPVR